MPISYETLSLAKKHAKQLFINKENSYVDGYGIIIEKEKISVDNEIIAEKNYVKQHNDILSQKIESVEQKIPIMSIATSDKLGVVKPKEGLHIDEEGNLKTTIQQYGDYSCGLVFLNHEETKTIKLFSPCYSIYLEFHLIDTIKVSNTSVLFLNTVSTKDTLTKGYLTATFDKRGVEITLTNNHISNAMFIQYGCADII